MNIVLIPNSYLPLLGGLEIAVNGLAKTLKENGSNVFIITTSLDDKYTQEVEISGVNVYRLPFFLPRKMADTRNQNTFVSLKRVIMLPFITVNVFIKFLHLLKLIKPDIVNLHYLGDNTVFCLLAKKIMNFKFVINLHGSDINRYAYRSFFPKMLIRRALQMADRVTVNSFDLLHKAEKIQTEIKNKSSVIYNGIFPADFEGNEKYQHTKPYILSVANFNHIKGQDILINAYSTLHQKRNDIDLLMAGDGPEVNKCIALAARLGISDSVKFMGRLTKEKIPPLLAGCKIFVLPSRQEAFGITILEAMASKKPVIATKAGGPEEIIKHLHNGLLVETESPESMSSAIELLLNNSELSDELAKRGYQHVIKYFSWDTIVVNYIKEYQALLM